jgi:RNA polymerase sigma-70 factor (ECF subfamily)
MPRGPRSDDDLLRAAREGDREAFGELHRRLARPAYALAYRLSGSADAAADVVQDAFIELLNGAESYRFDGKLRAYLFRMIANSVYSIHRSARARATALRGAVTPPAIRPGDAAVLTVAGQAAFDALGQLTHAERVVVILRACHEMRFTEIADVLVEPETTVKSCYHRAIRRLRRKLAAWEEPA